jgi:hypothetical protein
VAAAKKETKKAKKANKGRKAAKDAGAQVAQPGARQRREREQERQPRQAADLPPDHEGDVLVHATVGRKSKKRARLQENRKGTKRSRQKQATMGRPRVDGEPETDSSAGAAQLSYTAFRAQRAAAVAKASTTPAPGAAAAAAAAPPHGTYEHRGGVLGAGYDLHAGEYTVDEAIVKCEQLGAAGFTFEDPEAKPTDTVWAWFKSKIQYQRVPRWQSYVRNGAGEEEGGGDDDDDDEDEDDEEEEEEEEEEDEDLSPAQAVAASSATDRAESAASDGNVVGTKASQLRKCPDDSGEGEGGEEEEPARSSEDTATATAPSSAFAAQLQKGRALQKRKLRLAAQAAAVVAAAAAPSRSSQNKGGGKLRDSMVKKLAGARFRYLNELLYTTEGGEAYTRFQADPALFDVYHFSSSAHCLFIRRAQRGTMTSVADRGTLE